MSANTLRNSWFAYSKSRPDAQFRLFCFPYAGGSAFVFRNWSELLPASIEVWPIQLPGRAARLQERPFESMEQLVSAVEEAVRPWLDKPFAFFGHSMGATVAFELAHFLRLKQAREPAQLFVSGRRAPQVPETCSRTFELPDAEFVEELRRLEGTPAAVLEDQELLALLLPVLRADFGLIETYGYVARVPLTCSITALGGDADKDVAREDLVLWREQSSGPFAIHMFSGNHFFLHPQEPLVLEVIADQLSSLSLPTRQSHH